MDICRLWRLNAIDQQECIWAKTPDTLYGRSPKNCVILVGSDYVMFPDFRKWYDELVFNAKYKNITVEWDADITDGERNDRQNTV